MGIEGPWLTIALAAAVATAFLGCPSLGEIGVGPGELGTDAGTDRSDARAPREARAPEAAPEASACTANPASDPKNCGRCAHDCKGGACEVGVCQPYPIVTGNDGPAAVTVRDGVVYFTSLDNTVEKCVADDCINTLTQMTSGQKYPKGITTDTTNVYWVNEGFFVDGGFAGGVATCGLAGCPSGVATILATGEEWPNDLAVDTSAVYWTDQFGDVVRSCTVGGCGGAPTTVATDPTNLSGVAIDATSIFWAEPKLGNIIKCPLAGCASFTPFASGQTSPQKLDIANATLFWSANDAIMSCPTSGCGGAPQVFAKNQPSSFALAHDMTHLYWTLYDHLGQILSCPLSGCGKPTVLGEMQDLPSSVAVDNTAVYWTNSGGGSVMRVMK